MDVNGKVAIVTGAAGGIGAAIAQRLLERGARVVVSDLDAERVEESARRLAASANAAQSSPDTTDRPRVVAVAGDATSEDVIAAMIAAAQELSGPEGHGADMFFANAGVGNGSGLDCPESDWALAWDVNVMAHVRAARALVPGWLERGEGYFFTTASAAGLLTQIGSPVYAVTKHGALAFAEWLRVTYGDKGIRVSVLAPMGVDTALLHAGGESDDEEARKSNAAVVNAGGVISPLECADVVMGTVDSETFLCLPHPEVLKMYGYKAADYDRWIGGMQRFRDSLG